MPTGEAAIVQIAVEVQYGSGGAGALYFDQSGRIQRELIDQLESPPFVAGDAPVSAPFVVSTVHSPSERISIEFNHKHVLIQQAAAETIARIEMVAPIVWAEVSQRLELTKRVQRCGVRVWMMWPAASQEEAEARILAADLFTERPGVSTLFGGPPRRRAYTAVVGSDERYVRYMLTGGSASIRVEGEGEVPASLRKFHMEHGILLDVDSVHAFPVPATLNKADLRTLIRDTWRQTNETCRLLGDRLHGKQN
jgi:hypothetical protein